MIWSLIRLCIRVLPQPPQLATCPPLSRVGVKILFFARDGRLDGQSHRALRDDISLDLLGGTTPSMKTAQRRMGLRTRQEMLRTSTINLISRIAIPSMASNLKSTSSLQAGPGAAQGPGGQWADVVLPNRLPKVGQSVSNSILRMLELTTSVTYRSRRIVAKGHICAWHSLFPDVFHAPPFQTTSGYL